ncbi:hypothetical protein FE257_008584 [Aspergillus nanangensis]|uniref:Acyl-coenzyme A oxidase n=1 Tax=Aspergillus nanangensis TaxID=2582783 RepID=A0AAD4GT98_ASPNN|nr:hypothetical protein FE257_008584 [Aspergillus nanangensis]
MRDFTDNLRPSQPGDQILAQERAQSNLPVDDLAQHLLGYNGFLERQARVLPIVQQQSLFDKSHQQNLSRPDAFKQGLARAKLLRRLAIKHGWDLADFRIAEYLVDDVSPYFLHLEMFATTVREQGSPEQQAYWLPKIENWEIVGAYGQTELGHGSNVRGLELEARWDPQAKQFILHSPYLTASKWWNGTLGRIANHSIVVAQLMLPRPGSSGPEYVSHGPHPFIVQVRDMKTHQPLDGVVIGDIGPKYGYATMDNAYMLFDQFRIPHSALLSRYSSVDAQTGQYTKPEQPALVYGSLTAVRANIVQHARLVLARAVTVAVRYTTVRRQFRDRDGDPNGPELAVLDYPTVQIRILPLLATAFALHYTGRAMQDTYETTRREIEAGNFNNLANMHSMSSGLKSLCTTLVADGIETCRRALGGHGFGGGSGLIQLNNDYLSKPTVEGDNWMITQQTASYVIKKMTAAVKAPNSRYNDEVDGQFKEFIRNKQQGKTDYQLDILNNDQDILKSFQVRATALAYNAYRERVENKKSWNSLLVQLHKLSRAQSQSILVSKFFLTLSNEKNIPALAKETLLNLFRLFALYTMETESYEFFSCGAASQGQLDQLSNKIRDLMAQIRPHAVNLVDSWKIPDYLLDSALGRYDGRVYEDLFNRAHRLNPLNRETFNPNYWEDEVVKGVTDARLASSKL